MDHKEFSSRGGKVSSPKKTAAARKNAAKPRGTWATAIAYEYRSTTGELRFGAVLCKGKQPTKDENYWEWAEAKMLSDIGNSDRPIEEILHLSTRSMLI